jgi:hypothetical protein
MTKFKIHFGDMIEVWRLWGITFKTNSRWWFIGVSRQARVENAMEVVK